jgi:periplasmic divalent cation tolerance protein
MIVVITSCGSAEEADRIAEALVAERLAACVQILPLRSVYRWQGAIERAEEWQLQIKTRAALADRVEARIRALHGYDLSEIIALPVTAGSADYVDWVEAETDGD